MSSTAKFSSQTCTLPSLPELFDHNFLECLLPTTNGEEGFEWVNSSPDASVAGGSSELATLKAFKGLNVRSHKSLYRIDALLHDSWSEDPELTLRLIWNLRSIRDGKGEKELFYRAFGWLYEHHPRTAISNLQMVVAPVCQTSRGQSVPHGYWKDLLNILALVTCDEILDFHSRPGNFLRTYTPKNTFSLTKDALEDQTCRQRTKKQHRHHSRLVGKLAISEYRALYIGVARLFAERLRKDIQALDQLRSLDPNSEREQYRAIQQTISLAGKWAPTPGGSHDRVTNISTAICQLLFSTNENAGSDAIGPLPSIAPHPIPGDASNCTIYRSYYQRWILKPLRETLACPEPLMSANRWNEIQYSRVPSLCMARNREHFVLHDPEGFHLHLAQVQSKKRKFSATSFLPHELVAEAAEVQKAWDAAREEEYPKVAAFKRSIADQQLDDNAVRWWHLTSRLDWTSSFPNAIAVYALSESPVSLPEYDKTNVNPIFPSIALSLVLAYLTQPPFDSGFITLSETPTFVRLEGMRESVCLSDLVNDVLSLKVGGNPDLQAVFSRVLLPLAKEHNVPNKDMIKRVYIFSNMHFDHAAGIVTGPWWLNTTSETDRASRWEEIYSDSIVKAFEKAGYDVPEIVFWNMTGERTLRETVEDDLGRKGVRIMSGFSKEMMRSFWDEAQENGRQERLLKFIKDGDAVGVEGSDDEEEWMSLNVMPLEGMRKALFKTSYDGLVVLD
ncbi:hypothetical protein NP233_g9432 [Leucocoprinus birnbaumii]|uniref:Uncharacterized protein n=1 Tax=Leucocoprinus birnbaumii TaxID=56174 RepID=A0AAD5VKE0_9AGAR|nr:hypothetical protein NP233_g9432 [Leucocoprinus birnbaumii]